MSNISSYCPCISSVQDSNPWTCTSSGTCQEHLMPSSIESSSFGHIISFVHTQVMVLYLLSVWIRCLTSNPTFESTNPTDWHSRHCLLLWWIQYVSNDPSYCSCISSTLFKPLNMQHPQALCQEHLMSSSNGLPVNLCTLLCLLWADDVLVSAIQCEFCVSQITQLPHNRLINNNTEEWMLEWIHPTFFLL